MLGRMKRLVVVLVAVVLADVGAALGTPLCAQVGAVQGTVVTRMGEALGGVLVTAHDAAGREHARTITSSSGGFRLRPPGGVFRLSVSRIGYQRWFSPDYQIAGADTLRIRLDVDGSPVQLPELVAVSDLGCSSVADERASVLWEEARTGMASAVATFEAGQVTWLIDEVLRRMDASDRLVADTVRLVLSAAQWPVRALEADSLFRLGFVQARSSPVDLGYYGPDLDVLFDPRFLERHCLRAVPGPEGTNLTGVAFSPADGIRTPDITGAIWLDGGTRRLRALDFFYTGLPAWASKGSAGGRVEFADLPDGRWLVVRWRILAPIPILRPAGATLHGSVETEGAVVLARERGGDTLWSGPRLTGTRRGEQESAREHTLLDVRTENVKGQQLRRLVVRNRSDTVQVVQAIVLTHCRNLLERCARYPVNERLAPGERRTFLELRPWMSGRKWDFEASAEAGVAEGT